MRVHITTNIIISHPIGLCLSSDWLQVRHYNGMPLKLPSDVTVREEKLRNRLE
jgi:hypothetical protein